MTRWTFRHGLPVFPRGKEPTHPHRDRIAALNREIQALGIRPRVTFLDINARFLDPEGRIPDRLMPDHLHLSVEGYEIWGKAILDWLEPVQG